MILSISSVRGFIAVLHICIKLQEVDIVRLCAIILPYVTFEQVAQGVCGIYSKAPYETFVKGRGRYQPVFNA